jgi:valyl-tRNA synthetase
MTTLAASISTEATTSSDSTSSSKSSSVRPYDEENKEIGLGSYAPSEFESKIYKWWEASGCFDPDAKRKSPERTEGDDDEKKPYVLPMPPPNVTGRLHMGHAIFVALQDILARFHRMRGRPVLWLPG